MTRYFTIASAVLALAAAAPVVHAEAQGQNAVRVSYADLNMGTTSGRQAFDQRISHAIDKACGERPTLADLDGQYAFQACQKATRSSVDGQIKGLSTAVAQISDVAPGR